MSQVVKGLMLGTGVNGPICILYGNGDPGTNVSVGGGLVIDLDECDVGSIFVRNDAPDASHLLYVKTAWAYKSNGTWAAK